jgi:altronate dehydratase small subunit
MTLNLALKVHEDDNVATIFAQGIVAGASVEARDKKGASETVTVRSDIPYGHKAALRDIHPGERVLKYGEAIGRATAEIRKGDHVHVHNMDSERGRGDLEEVS